MLTSWGIEMEVLILGWYILTETGSVLLLTVYSSLQYTGTLIAPMFGMAGDRFGHRNILCAMRLCYAGLASVLMVMAFTGAMRPLYVLLIAGLNGLVRPSDLAMRQALVADIMPNDQLMAAMGVARTTADSARIFGSLAGATLVALLGIGPAYVAVTSCYSGGLFLTSRIASGKPGAPASTRGGLAFLKEVWEGVTYVRQRPLEMAGIWVAFLVNFLAFPITMGLLPYVAKNVYHINQTGLGTLVASFAIGSCVGSLTIGVIGRLLRPARMMLIFACAWFALLLIFVQIPSPGPRPRRADAGGLFPEHEHGAAGDDPAEKRRPEVSRPGHGCPHVGDLRPADRLAARGHIDPVDRLSRHGVGLLRAGDRADGTDRPAMARRDLAARRGRQSEMTPLC